MYLVIIGIVVFFTQCRLLHLLRYNKTIAILGHTLAKSSTTMLGFGLIATILFYAFASGTSVMYNQIQSYSTMYQTMQTLIVAFLGKFDFSQLVDYYGTFAGYYLLTYLLVMIVLISNVFVSILNEFLNTVGNSRSLEKKDHEVIDHFFNKIKSLVSENKYDYKSSEIFISKVLFC